MFLRGFVYEESMEAFTDGLIVCDRGSYAPVENPSYLALILYRRFCEYFHEAEGKINFMDNSMPL